MRIKQLKKETPESKRFAKREWKIADREHYGKNPDFRKKEYTFVMVDAAKIVGRLTLSVKAGVAEIQTVLVAKQARGRKVGTALMEKAEKVARAHRVHKLWLQTGKGWDAEQFYKKLGYKRGGILKNHYARHDFVFYTKDL